MIPRLNLLGDAGTAIPNFTPDYLPPASAIDDADPTTLFQILREILFFQNPLGLPWDPINLFTPDQFTQWANNHPSDLDTLKNAAKNMINGVSSGISTVGTIASYLPWILLGLGGIAILIVLYKVSE